jgi:hypothetical protein
MKHMRRSKTITWGTLTFYLLVSGCTRGGDSGDDTSSAGRLAVNAATASSGSETAAFAIDHDLQKGWNSGTSAPAWIQLDFGQPTEVARLRLYTEQTPPGPTVHQILGGTTPDNLASLGTLDGDTATEQWLELQVKGQVRYLRIVTVKSPSWVAWREIEAYE